MYKELELKFAPTGYIFSWEIINKYYWVSKISSFLLYLYLQYCLAACTGVDRTWQVCVPVFGHH